MIYDEIIDNLEPADQNTENLEKMEKFDPYLNEVKPNNTIMIFQVLPEETNQTLDSTLWKGASISCTLDYHKIVLLSAVVVMNVRIIT